MIIMKLFNGLIKTKMLNLKLTSGYWRISLI